MIPENVAIVENIPETAIQKCDQVTGDKEDYCFYKGTEPIAAQIAGQCYMFAQIPANVALLNRAERQAFAEFLQGQAHYFAGQWEGAKNRGQVAINYRLLSFYRVLLARLLKFELPYERQLAVLHNLYTYTALGLPDIASILNVKARKTTQGILERAGVKVVRYSKRQASAKFSEKLLMVTPPPAPPPPLFDPAHVGPEPEEILTSFLENLMEDDEGLVAWRDVLSRALDVDRYAAGAFVDGLAGIAHHPATQKIIKSFVQAQLKRA